MNRTLDTSDVATPLNAIRALHTALEAGRHGGELRELFTSDAVNIEHPNTVTPQGATRDRATTLAGSDTGAGLLASQRYDVHDEFEHGEVAVVRLTWTGVIGADRGPFRAGDELVAHIAQFVTVIDGKISRLETFDCYEPFPTTA